MKILRTPDSQFERLKDYPFKPVYTNIATHDGSELRIHHIDEGPKDGPILLAMHGQPVWSYLYIRMLPFLVNAGIRIIAPDLPGYGKSDKPASRQDYSYGIKPDVEAAMSEKEIKDFKIENLGTLKDSQYRIAETTLLKALAKQRNEAYKPGSANLNAAL